MSSDRNGFWRDAFALQGSVTPLVFPYVLTFGLFAAGICLLAWICERTFDCNFGLEVAPHEIAGAALGLILILRTNAGYDRWWEARKLWGGIVNQSRNLAISAVSYGPADQAWRDQFVRWAAVFPHAARCSLRGERESPEIADLVGRENAEHIASADHMPSYVAWKLGALLRAACDHHQLNGFAFIQIDKERALLIDHIGACERILKTPLPQVYSIKIRRFITLFLLSLPLALLHRMSNDWLVPFITMLVAYPLISLDQIGVELQNPFAKQNLSHLPLGDISATIQRNLAGILKTGADAAAPASPRYEDYLTSK